MEQRIEYCLFCGPDIIVPATGSRPAFAGEAPARLAARALGRRDYEGLGSAEGWRITALALDEEAAAAAVASGSRRMGLRQALSEFAASSMAGALRGAALLRWLEVAQRCGACGGALVDQAGSEDPGGRACASCGRVFFPRISPAVIVLVRKGGKVLLAHNARFPAGRFGLIAGYVEAGETFEEAAVREAREEAGIAIRDLRYVKSQPWPFPDSLMIAFTAEWESGEARPDGVEIADLRWCGPDELPDIPPPGSVARYLIDRFVREERGAPLRGPPGGSPGGGSAS
jgi:NAD+ diphosphatase